MAVQKISSEELKAYRNHNPENFVVINPQNQQKITNKFYVNKISDKQIAEFFAPYEYRLHERSDDGSTIFVLCDSFETIFDDFTVMTAPVQNFYINHSQFYERFLEICEEANITPTQAISDRLESEIFNKMPYYVEKKKTFTETNLKSIKKNPEFGKLLKPSLEKQEHRENFAYLNKQFGDTNPEKIADTLARLTPNK